MDASLLLDHSLKAASWRQARTSSKSLCLRGLPGLPCERAEASKQLLSLSWETPLPCRCQVQYLLYLDIISHPHWITLRCYVVMFAVFAVVVCVVAAAVVVVVVVVVIVAPATVFVSVAIAAVVFVIFAVVVCGVVIVPRGFKTYGRCPWIMPSSLASWAVPHPSSRRWSAEVPHRGLSDELVTNMKSR